MSAPPQDNRISASQALPWRNTLFLRVVLLCGVLLLCLFAAVITITRHFFQEAAQQMEAQTADIAHSVELRFEEGFQGDYKGLEGEVMDLHKGFDIRLEDYAGEAAPDASFTIERRGDGSFVRVARVPLMNDGRRVLMTATVTMLPQTEILRAFTNKYLLAVTAVFLAALGMMVWVIWRALHPLRRLSESCAAVSSGHLEPVSTRGASGEVFALETTFNRMIASLREKETVEAKLRQAQRLSALGTLAAGVAHDVRNPLNAIKLLSSHAMDLVGGADTPAARPLQTIRTEVGRLEEIVSGFLSLARESELHPEPTELDALLQECVRLFQREAGQRGVRLQGEYGTGGLRLMLDPKQINRAVLNVLLNALEACPEGGRVRLFSRLTDRACQVEIRDDGPGLDRETLEHVFDPYYTTKPGGTGLGLSITRGVIEEHGGVIEMTGSPGQGCQVLISFPLDRVRAD
ncbi:MAG: HAMP domain-containing protein [Candidatus Hydrogenedentes bacterium]|nr:HAMP domain-containing protein [Candidatus Hydrogenedentota bacterium]